MNKREAIAAFAKKTGRTKKSSAEILEDIIDFVYETLVRGDSLDIYGFLELSTRETPDRKSVSPSREKEEIIIKGRRQPKAKFSVPLKEAIRYRNNPRG